MVYEKAVIDIARHLLDNNVLILTNGCASFPLMKLGYCTRGAADRVSEPLRGILKAANLPAALHAGECLDNSRSAAIFRAVADACGQPLHRMPMAYVSPEWSNEKGIASPKIVQDFKGKKKAPLSCDNEAI